MAKRIFTDESLTTLVEQTKSYVDSSVSNKVDKVSGKGLSTNDYTTTEKNKLSGIATGAEVNQNAFSNVKVGTTTIAADAKTDTIEFVGSNVTITPNATNDKVTFAVADGSTSEKGVVQLTDSTSSTSTITAATPNSVKSAYDLANTANTKAESAQTTADGKSDKGHKHTVSEITDLTATATELNYMDGVTSNVQTQLDGKSNSTHTHSAEDVGALPNSYANHYGVMCLKQGSGSEGGELHLEASVDTPTQSGIILDQCNSSFRIFGIPSADGTTRTGPGTPLVIDPYNKNIIGGYTFDGAATTLSQTLPITKGGTGSTSRGEANQNLTCIGANPITSTSNDTTTNWNAIGTGHCYYAVNGCLIGQPSRHGVLVNFTYGYEVFQLFNQQAYGGLNYRSGNYYGWDGQTQTTNSWKKIYDTGNIQKGNWAITSGSNLANDYIYLQYE